TLIITSQSHSRQYGEPPVTGIGWGGLAVLSYQGFETKKKNCQPYYKLQVDNSSVMDYNSVRGNPQRKQNGGTS
ncbi:MAG: hypothetical protein IIZ68_02570, partial [Clostridia bacterium]|nr:hypothetical protein [Clostridia bacterium]